MSKLCDKKKKKKKKKAEKKAFIEKLKQLLSLKEGCDRRHIFWFSLSCARDTVFRQDKEEPEQQCSCVLRDKRTKRGFRFCI
jgi:hypothetical protein